MTAWRVRARGVGATAVVAVCCLGLGAVGGLVVVCSGAEDPALVSKLSSELVDARAEVERLERRLADARALSAETEALSARLAEVERRLEEPPGPEETLALLLPLLQMGLMAGMVGEAELRESVEQGLFEQPAP